MSSPLAEAFFLWTILTVVMKHPLRDFFPVKGCSDYLKCNTEKTTRNLPSQHCLLEN